MTDPAQTRQSLLLELGRRSDDAWTEFVGIYETAILAACRARGLQDADARDATQEVLAAVHRKIVEGGGFDPEKGRFRAWLARVARNVSVDVLTARARRAPSGDLVDDLPDQGTDDEEAFDLEVRRALFDRAAVRVRGEVKPTTWRAFEMTAVEGKKPAEVADVLGLTVGNVHVAKCRVLARIAERVDAFQIED
ncbi:MAG: sigma-70 family RNA polymerase sigma factor [Planctomycetota bacterium]